MSLNTPEHLRGTLLVVGASDRVQPLVRSVERHGCEVVTASTAQEGLALLDTTSVDLVLLSPDVSDANGYELCRQIKGRSSTCAIPILFAVDLPKEGSKSAPAAAFMAGGSDCIVAPFDSDDAIACLERHLALVTARRRRLGGLWPKSEHDQRHSSLSSRPGPTQQVSPQRDQADRDPAGLELFQLATVQAIQLKQGRDFSHLLKRVVHVVRETLDEARILQTAIDELGKGLGLDYGNAALHQFSRDIAAQHIYSRNNSNRNDSNRNDSNRDNGSDRDVESIQPSRSDLVRLNPLFCEGQEIQFCQNHAQWGRQLILACPIVDSRGLLGSLWLSRPADRDITPPEVLLTQHVADQCAIAIRQARLYKMSQDHVELLEGLHRQKDDFLSTVSHELRSPVTNMKMAIQMLSMSLNGLSDRGLSDRGLSDNELPQSPVTSGGATQTTVVSPPIAASKLKQYLQILSGECDREISLINDLLDLQRLDSGAQPPSVSLVPLTSWLADIIQPFEDRMQDRQQSLTFQGLTPLPSFRTDTVAVQRILTELLDNACKYTPDDGTILVTARMVDHALQIQVTNSGIEIPPQHLPYIFDKFYRVPSNVRWQKGGTGLGLALVKQLINHIGGTVQVHSQHEKTSFRVMIPGVDQQ